MATFVAIALTVVLVFALGGYLPLPIRARRDTHSLLRARPRMGIPVRGVAALFAIIIALAAALHFVAP